MKRWERRERGKRERGREGKRKKKERDEFAISKNRWTKKKSRMRMEKLKF